MRATLFIGLLALSGMATACDRAKDKTKTDSVQQAGDRRDGDPRERRQPPDRPPQTVPISRSRMATASPLPPPPVTVEIPFTVVRELLPPDGLPPEHPELRPIYARNVISKVIGHRNQWPQNPPGFERDETVEFAFGYILRAKKGDRYDPRDSEGPWGPGFQVRQDHVRIQGSWRVHKNVGGGVDDYFDGTFVAKLQIAMQGSRLRIAITELNVDWRGGILDNAVRGLQGLIAQLIKAELNEQVERKAIEPIEDFIRGTESLARLRSETAVAIINGSTVRFVITFKQ
jgi:hypothetical protein